MSKLMPDYYERMNADDVVDLVQNIAQILYRLWINGKHRRPTYLRFVSSSSILESNLINLTTSKIRPTHQS